jgi:hypothetical protein
MSPAPNQVKTTMIPGPNDRMYSANVFGIGAILVKEMSSREFISFAPAKTDAVGNKNETIKTSIVTRICGEAYVLRVPPTVATLAM